MKKLFITMAVVAVICVCSCTKDNSQVKQGAAVYDENAMKIKTLVDGFKARMNSDFKSSEVLSVDSAEWYIETTLNFSYANSGEFRKAVKDSVKCVINPDRDLVTMSDVSVAYDAMLRGISDGYYSISDNDKSLDYVNVKRNYLDNGDTELVGYYSVGIDRQDAAAVTPTYIGFGPTDYWHAMKGLGKCDIHAGQFIGRDAATELHRLCNTMHVPKYAYKLGYKLVWTEVDPNCSRYKNIWAGGAHECLDPDRMNNILFNVVPAILSEDIPQGKVCKDIQYLTEPGLGMKGDSNYGRHYMEITAGIPIYVRSNDGYTIPRY